MLERGEYHVPGRAEQVPVAVGNGEIPPKIYKIRYRLGCALTFASEAKFEIEAKISFRLEAKKKPDFT